jgi:hypothetical protein
VLSDSGCNLYTCRLTLELRERQARVDVLSSKYETLAIKGRSAGDFDNGEPKSQAYYIVKVGCWHHGTASGNNSSLKK